MEVSNTIYDFRKELQNLGYSKNAVNNYPKYVRELLGYSKENPQKITDRHIKSYYEYLKEKPKQRGKGKLSESHVCSQMSAVKLYFDYLERTGTVKQNPYNLKIRQPVKKERQVFTQAQIKLLYKSCESLQETVILHLCYGCGLRRNEAELLNVKDVHFEQKLLFVRKGKGKKRRVIPLTELIVEDLKHYYYQTEIYRKTESFLINKNGNAITGHTVYETFKKLMKRAKGINEDNYCLHSLRHSIATHLLENEMSIEMVRDFLGHSQLITTQVYTRINLLKTKLQ